MFCHFPAFVFSKKDAIIINSQRWAGGGMSVVTAAARRRSAVSIVYLMLLEIFCGYVAVVFLRRAIARHWEKNY